MPSTDPLKGRSVAMRFAAATAGVRLDVNREDRNPIPPMRSLRRLSSVGAVQTRALGSGSCCRLTIAAPVTVIDIHRH